MPENARADSARAREQHDAELAGIDALDIPVAPAPRLGRRFWQATWPKLAALTLLVIGWQIVVWTQWKPEYVLPSPLSVFRNFFEDLTDRDAPLLRATYVTLRRAATGYGIALLIGALVGMAVAGSRTLRAAVGSLITGIQTMPSIAWFPLAILLFRLSERAILFVVILGAAPAIANGLISGIDHIPPVLIRAGRVLGARRLTMYRYVILPAALPAFVAGMKQGWAFAWRSLVAGELLVIIANRPSLGVRLQFARETSNAESLLAAMLVILLIGIIVDAVLFGRLERSVNRRRGLAAT